MTASRLPIAHGEDAQKLRLTEIFYSLQGESSHQGLPCIFIRLTGCNLRCTWCDTEYSFTGGETISVDAVIDKISNYPCRLVEITGGEPLLQKAAQSLATRLLKENYTVLCETSGERDIDLMPPGVKRIVDFKAPGSGEVAANRWDNIDKLRDGDEVKIVIKDREDFDWALELVVQHKLTDRVPVLFSPVHEIMDAEQLAEWILKTGYPIRFNQQLHKQIWGDRAGV
jgi:7-carboxy-7-deazaguanine synthase